MGGKRPDQYRIDPGEAGATDYKTRKTGKEAEIEDRRLSETMEGRTEKGQPVPSDAPDPASRKERERLARDHDEEGDDKPATEGK